MNAIRTVIVDDSALAREAIVDVLGEDGGFAVVGEAACGEEAVAVVRALEPDLVLMDVRMPGAGGVWATAKIKAHWPAVCVVMLSVSDDVADLFAAIRSGAQGYLLKNLDPAHWCAYLRQAAARDVPISRDIASLIIADFARANPAPERADERLTEREMEVLRLVAGGQTNEEIAARLHIAMGTVKNHLRSILAKLHLRNRTELTSYAYRAGIVRWP